MHLDDNLKKHVISFFKGLLAALVTQVCITTLQYIGAHIPTAVTILSMTATSTATIIKSN